MAGLLALEEGMVVDKRLPEGRLGMEGVEAVEVVWRLVGMGLVEAMVGVRKGVVG